MTPSPATKVVLLLCGRFGRGENNSHPLTLSEFNTLTGWLNERNLGMADFLKPDTLDAYTQSPASGITPDRIGQLMQRESDLGAILSVWQDSGIWIISRADEQYPLKASEILGKKAPVLIFGVGDPGLLNREGIAIVGSRNIDQAGEEFAYKLGEACARAGLAVVSGGARGADSWGMRGALENGGRVIGVLAGDLGKTASSEMHSEIDAGRLTLAGLHNPEVPFSVGAAMERNKLIYALAQAAVIVSADEGSGGTWAGAEENHRHWHVPLWVRDAEIPGNRKMIRMGWGGEIPNTVLDDPAILIRETAQDTSIREQANLF